MSGKRRRPALRATRPPYPTLFSSFIASSFCASTANSIGSCWNTSLQKPLMIRLMASSRGIPRDYR